MPYFVRFMHNGREPTPDSETGINWNRKKHARKFLKCSGIQLDEDLKKLREEIMFWGEWEPESALARKIENTVENGPHYVYEPYYIRPRSYEALQNTDPFVFGGEFRYSWCLQPSRRSLRDLDRGSVILFGSHVNWKFVLDTVFVVSDYIPYSKGNCEELLRKVDETYKTVTVNPILMGKTATGANACTQRVNSTTYRSYRGVTFEERTKYNGMFSFFPCQAYTEDSAGFARPTIQMPTISDKMGRSIKITPCNDINDVSEYWNEMVKQVTETCSLGVFAEMPPERRSG